MSHRRRRRTDVVCLVTFLGDRETRLAPSGTALLPGSHGRLREKSKGTERGQTNILCVFICIIMYLHSNYTVIIAITVSPKLPGIC